MRSILILPLFFSLTAFGQADTNLPAKPLEFTKRSQAANKMLNGLKQGRWVEYYMLKREGEVETKDTGAAFYKLTTYESGRPVDTLREYYKGGKLYLTIPYTLGKRNGTEVCYDEKGNVKYEVVYKFGEAVKTRRYDNSKIYDKKGKVKKKINP